VLVSAAGRLLSVGSASAARLDLLLGAVAGGLRLLRGRGGQGQGLGQGQGQGLGQGLGQGVGNSASASASASPSASATADRYLVLSQALAREALQLMLHHFPDALSSNSATDTESLVHTHAHTRTRDRQDGQDGQDAHDPTSMGSGHDEYLHKGITMIQAALAL
jgi:hypothetical protein